MANKNLVIVESPAKAKNIEKFLGKDFKVMSSFGHIRDLKKKNFGVDLDTFQPEYEIPTDKKHVVAELRAEAKKADTIWLASDEDREGEAISWHLAEVLKLNPATAKRIVFHEVTKPAILKAIEEPRTIDMGMVDAQQARRVLDRLVGFRLSPVLWRRVRPSLSAGRVQSVAVKLIVERERKILNFVPETSFRVSAVFTLDDGKEVRATLNKAFANQENAEAFLESCRTAEYTITDVQKSPKKRTPAPPFTTSTLQQEAARKLGFPVSLTMRVAQSLYESGYITYMRTDSTNLSNLCLSSATKVIEEQMGKEYHQYRTYHTSAKGAQEAHEAIRPTDMSRESIKGTAQEQRLYQLIWKRTIACQMADAQMERTTATISISNREEFFQAAGEVVLFDGFLRVYRESNDNDNEGENESENILPAMEKGEKVQRQQMQAQLRYTQAPVRYTEASLVDKLEELGIGRPSTYAPTISTIQQREYVVRGDKEGTERPYTLITLEGNNITTQQLTEIAGQEKGRLLPTDIGIVVTDFLEENFKDIMDYNFTANVEKDFDTIAEGKKEWTGLIREFYDDFNKDVENSMSNHQEHRVGEKVLGTDPKTGEPVSVKIGRFGPMAQYGEAGEGKKPRFATLNAGMSIETVTLEEVLELFQLPRTLGKLDDIEIKIGTGRFGPYIQYGRAFISIPKEEEPLDVTMERATQLIRENQEAEKKSHLKQFDEDPELEIRAGRYGAYIAYKGTNYKIPKAKLAKATELSYAECMEIVNTPQPARRGKKA